MAKRKRKAGEGMVRLRSDGRWEGRMVIGYDDKGLPRTKNVTARTKGECEDKLHALRETLGHTAERARADMPFGEWMDFWYRTYCQPALRDTTRAGYENSIYAHIIPELGNIALNKLTQNDLQQFYARLKTNGRLQYTDTMGTGVSDRLVRSCHGRCRTALERAVTDGLIASNPAAGCRLPPKKDREMQVLMPQEIAGVLAQAREEGYYELFLLELSTGMRRGEILGLKWEDLNLRTGELYIRREVVLSGSRKKVMPPKTKASVRTLLLPPYMTEILAEMKTEAAQDWIFPSPRNPGEPRDPSAVYHRTQLILERAGCKKVRFHDIRHTFSTMAIENEMDVKTLSDMIGHVSAETTLNIYSHVTDTMRKQAAIRIDRQIAGSDTPLPEQDSEQPVAANPAENSRVEPYKPKCCRQGTGCITRINDHLYEGRYSPRVNGKRLAKNIYAGTREECEEKLAELIRSMKEEIAGMKEAANG